MLLLYSSLEEGEVNMVNEIKQFPFLTDKQASVLRFLYDYLKENRYMPTRREVAQFLELKSDNSTAYLNALEKKGYLSRSEERTKRNLLLTPLAYEKLEFELNVKLN